MYIVGAYRLYILRYVQPTIVCHLFPAPKPEIKKLHCALHRVAKKDTLESVEMTMYLYKSFTVPMVGDNVMHTSGVE